MEQDFGFLSNGPLSTGGGTMVKDPLFYGVREPLDPVRDGNTRCPEGSGTLGHHYAPWKDLPHLGTYDSGAGGRLENEYFM